jgi:aminoglycoside phosphotransferase family enzyme/predicted kinase
MDSAPSPTSARRRGAPRSDEPPSGGAGVLPPDLHDWLSKGAGRGWGLDRVVATSLAWVFLYREAVLKLKRPVDFGFVDFTTLEKRRWAVERELAFNRSIAPDIYRTVHAITRSDGGLQLDGPGDAVEWALEMRRFDENAVLLDHPEAVRDNLAEKLGRQIGRFHAAAPLGAKGGGAAGMAEVVESNSRQFTGLPGFAPNLLRRLTERTWAALHNVERLLDERLAAGYVRRCHGDLHLGNILLEQGRPVLFDCIEFNDAIAEIDVLYDLAFLLMDLHLRDATAGANRVLNGWLDETARTFGPDLWRGLAALPLWQAVRATIRAHVCGHAGDLAQGARYLDAAERHLEPAAPVLIAIGGLSGSGKSTLARAIAPKLDPSPGAVVLRSDEIRKRLWRTAPTARLPSEAYDAGVSAQVYDAMLATAETCLNAGWPVILDAVFLDAQERSRAEAAARAADVPFAGVWLEGPAELLKARLAARGPDASDADALVLEQQLARASAEMTWMHLPAHDLNLAGAVALNRVRSLSNVSSPAS